MQSLLNIDPVVEEKKIIAFIKAVLSEQGFQNIVIGLSGGVDSTVSLALAVKAVAPENIFVVHSYYFESQINSLKPLLGQMKIPEKNIYNVSIKNAVDEIKKTTGLTEADKDYQIRLGNIMSRVRMIALYDLAKKHSALACGTENKSELLLGYFTRFGDEASDLEPIQHLYKTQVYQLASHLEIPKKIINASPTAGLWAGQTDESDFGFSYQEADQVLTLYFDQKKSVEIISQEFPNAQKIIDRASQNAFKHHLPYTP